MALKDILGDGTKYQNDMVIALPDGTSMTVGEMRGLEAEEKAALVKRQTLMTNAEQELAGRILAAQRNGLLDDPSRRTEPEVRTAITNTFPGLDENDPLFGQVAKEMKRIQVESETRVKAIETDFTKKFDDLKAITAKAIGVNLNDHYSSKFGQTVADLPTDIRGKVKLEDALKYAETNRLMDASGRYDISLAVDRMTWNDVKEHERKQITAEATAAATKSAQMASLKPGGNRSAITSEAQKDTFSPFTKEGDRTRTKSLDEVLAEAANDEALWSSALTLTGGQVH